MGEGKTHQGVEELGSKVGLLSAAIVPHVNCECVCTRVCARVCVCVRECRELDWAEGEVALIQL